VAALATESTISLPGIPLWVGTQMKVTDWQRNELVLRGYVYVRHGDEGSGYRKWLSGQLTSPRR